MGRQTKKQTRSNLCERNSTGFDAERNEEIRNDDRNDGRHKAKEREKD